MLTLSLDLHFDVLFYERIGLDCLELHKDIALAPTSGQPDNINLKHAPRQEGTRTANILKPIAHPAFTVDTRADFNLDSYRPTTGAPLSMPTSSSSEHTSPATAMQTSPTPIASMIEVAKGVFSSINYSRKEIAASQTRKLAHPSLLLLCSIYVATWGITCTNSSKTLPHIIVVCLEEHHKRKLSGLSRQVDDIYICGMPQDPHKSALRPTEDASSLIGSLQQ